MLREIDLNENIINSNEDNQEEEKTYLPDLNELVMEDATNVEELDVDFNQSHSTSELLSTSKNSFQFDLNNELFMEDDTQIGETLQQSNLNNDHSPPHNSSSNSFPIHYNDGLEDIMPQPQSNLQYEFDINIQNQQALSVSEILSSSDIEHSVDDVSNLEVPIAPTTRKNLKNVDRRAIYNSVLTKCIEGRLIDGALEMVASKFLVSRRTVQRIWKQGKNSGVHVDVSHKKTTNCGRKRVQIDFDRMRDIPLRKRTTVRDLSYEMNVSRTTLHRALKSQNIRRHSNAIKPFLKEENKRDRLRFCLSMLDGASLPHDPTFLGMYNTVHIDEKWFYLSKKSQNYYLLPEEEDPIRTCKSKNFITKVMFLSVVARPRLRAQYNNEPFSGKLGLFPFVTQEPAKRNSINRAAGTMETKPITSVNRAVIRKYLIEKVLPAIKEKWPREDIGSPIFIQQDNARTHFDCNDDEFRRAASQDGFDIRLVCQPANSPDLNVLDLGYFRAIQSLQYKKSPKSVDDLVKAVEESFEEFSTEKSNRIFLTLQSCMIEILKARGCNKYNIPHLGKESLEREGLLPTVLKCDATLVQEIVEYLG